MAIFAFFGGKPSYLFLSLMFLVCSCLRHFCYSKRNKLHFTTEIDGVEFLFSYLQPKVTDASPIKFNI